MLKVLEYARAGASGGARSFYMQTASFEQRAPRSKRGQKKQRSRLPR